MKLHSEFKDQVGGRQIYAHPPGLHKPDCNPGEKRWVCYGKPSKAERSYGEPIKEGYGLGARCKGVDALKYDISDMVDMGFDQNANVP